MATSLLIVLLVLLGFSAGLVASVWWARRVSRARRRIPTQWPLDPRRVANSQERAVWRWLNHAFADHHVMAKLPVTRFTLPRTGENSGRLYQLLNGVYCTFTICRDDGRVVGCVDVPGLQGISRVNRQIKLTLLSQCGMAYRVMRANDLPSVAEIRNEFLGEESISLLQRNRERAAVHMAQQKLRAAVERRRHTRPSAHHSLADSGRDSDPTSLLFGNDFAPNAWQQPNSFIAPLDSRPAALA